jgi:AcrR family transcriptional regulator
MRSRIVDGARRLFNRNGFESVSVDAIMAEAGLTRGAFYAYFESKSDLYAETLGCFFTDPNWRSRWEAVDVDLTSAEAGPQIVRAYLSQQHFEDVENSCPMVALPSDVARSDQKVKAAFENVFRAMVKVLSRDVKNTMQPSEDTAMAIAGLCIGGMVVARSLNDSRLSDHLRDAATHAALVLGGWTRDAQKSLSPSLSARSRASMKRTRKGLRQTTTRAKR